MRQTRYKEVWGKCRAASIGPPLLLAGEYIYSVAVVPDPSFVTIETHLLWPCNVMEDQQLFRIPSGLQCQIRMVEASSFIDQEVTGFLPSPTYKKPLLEYSAHMV